MYYGFFLDPMRYDACVSFQCLVLIDRLIAKQISVQPFLVDCCVVTFLAMTLRPVFARTKGTKQSQAGIRALV